MSHDLSLTDALKVPSHGPRSWRLVYDLGVMEKLLPLHPSLLAKAAHFGYDLAWDEILLCIWAQQIERQAMEMTRRRDHQRKIAPAQRLPGRNEPCPCGSGRKFKNCHGGTG